MLTYAVNTVHSEDIHSQATLLGTPVLFIYFYFFNYTFLAGTPVLALVNKNIQSVNQSATTSNIVK